MKDIYMKDIKRQIKIQPSIGLFDEDINLQKCLQIIQQQIQKVLYINIQNTITSLDIKRIINKKQSKMSTATQKPSSVPVTNKITVIYNWAHYVIALIANDKSKYETVSTMVKQFQVKSQLCVIFIKNSTEVDTLIRQLKKIGILTNKIKSCIYAYSVSQTMQDIKNCAYKIFIFTNNCLDDLKKHYFPNVVNLIINLTYPDSFNNFQPRLMKTREQDCNIINKGLIINLFSADGDKQSTELTKKTIRNFAQSQSIAVTTLDLKNNPNSFVKLGEHFCKVKITQKPQSVKNPQKKQQQKTVTLPVQLYASKNYSWATYHNIQIKSNNNEIPKSINDIIKNTKFTKCYIYINKKSLADQIQINLRINQHQYLCLLVNISNLQKQTYLRQSKITIVCCEQAQNIKNINNQINQIVSSTPQDVDLVIIDNQIDSMCNYEQILFKISNSSGTVISFTNNNTFPTNLKQFIDKWKLKSITYQNPQNYINSTLNINSSKYNVGSRPASTGKNADEIKTNGIGYSSASSYGVSNPQVISKDNKIYTKYGYGSENNKGFLQNYKHQSRINTNNYARSPIYNINTKYEAINQQGYQNVFDREFTKVESKIFENNGKNQEVPSVINLGGKKKPEIGKLEIKITESKFENPSILSGRPPLPVLKQKKQEAKKETVINNKQIKQQQKKEIISTSNKNPPVPVPQQKKQEPKIDTVINKQMKQQQKKEELGTTNTRSSVPVSTPQPQQKQEEAKKAVQNTNNINNSKPTPDNTLSRDKLNAPSLQPQQVSKAEKKFQLLVAQSRSNKNQILQQLRKISNNVGLGVIQKIQNTSKTIIESIEQLQQSVMKKQKIQQIVSSNVQKIHKNQINISQKLGTQIKNKINQSSNTISTAIAQNNRLQQQNTTKILTKTIENTKQILNGIQSSMLTNCTNLQLQDNRMVNNLHKLQQSVNKNITKQVQSANKNIVDVVRQQTAKIISKQDKLQQILISNKQNSVSLEQIQKLMAEFVQKTHKQNADQKTKKIIELEQKYLTENIKISKLQTELQLLYRNNKDQCINIEMLIKQNERLQVYIQQKIKILKKTQQQVQKLEMEMTNKPKKQIDSIKSQLQSFYQKTFNKKFVDISRSTIEEQHKCLFAEVTALSKQYQNLKQILKIKQNEHKKLQQYLIKLKQQTDQASKRGQLMDPNMIPQQQIKTYSKLININNICDNVNNIIELANRHYFQKSLIIEQQRVQQQSFVMKQHALINGINVLKKEKQQLLIKSNQKQIIIMNLENKFTKLCQDNKKNIVSEKEKVVEFYRKRQINNQQNLSQQNKKLQLEIQQTKSDYENKIRNMEKQLMKQKQKYKKCEQQKTRQQKQFQHSMLEQTRNQKDIINRIQGLKIHIDNLTAQNKEMKIQLSQVKEQKTQMQQQHARHIQQINRQADLQQQKIINQAYERHDREILVLKQEITKLSQARR